jgi:hypothetical protein
MATKFKRDQVVKVRTVVPEGPVLALRMDEDGVVYYLLQWVDQDGNQQERWFAEDVLMGI